MKNHSQNLLIIIFLNNVPYHAGFLANDLGIFDLSLLGSKLTDEKSFYVKEFTYKFYDIKSNKIPDSVSFYLKPCIITQKIIDKERKNRGWYKLEESADYILKFRNIRSKNPSDMNCIEWIVYGLELGDIEIPNNILTASKLSEWANTNLTNVNYIYKIYE